MSENGVLFNKSKTILIQFPQIWERESYSIPSSVTSIGDYAFDCSSLDTVSIPNSVTSIGDYAFDWSSLTTISIPISVTNIGKSAFENCNKNLIISGNAESFAEKYTKDNKIKFSISK